MAVGACVATAGNAVAGAVVGAIGEGVVAVPQAASTIERTANTVNVEKILR